MSSSTKLVTIFLSSQDDILQIQGPVRDSQRNSEHGRHEKAKERQHLDPRETHQNSQKVPVHQFRLRF